MNLRNLTAFTLCILFLSQAFVSAEDMDKELATLAEKLATTIKEAGKKKIATLDFTDLQGGSSELGKYVAEQLTVDMVMAKRDFAVLDRANLNRILSEHKLTATGLVDPENAKKLGQFAGVDALVIGTIVPKGQKIALTAKIIATDTAEIVGAAKSEFASDETVQQLLSQTTAPGDVGIGDQSRSNEKPFGNLQAKIESVKLLPPPSPGFLIAELTMTVSNPSASKTYGVAVQQSIYDNFNLSNSRGNEFKTTSISGIDTMFKGFSGWQGSITRVLPRETIRIVAKCQLSGGGVDKIGDYRPYRLQAVLIWGEEIKGSYADLQKYSYVTEIK